ncbi:hypothetical protein PUNSTDRAFT_141035 [Punctularia strigosozonata HHB-11173 SS5]|uniref:uncharacterized protein n=1 Tax=Punctularia strigosozonata (strain HHB-11173) TaxID=741275 RepID=UPI0004417686|nr:uncharacterized protein PUNSTDRAFT_141035 [Punctularia strigosozonata HHB-11173 SS5]EIN12274.1 hypothetical protein PUNSTDRAFT_141035 [Punctularia strigosozonata HHB-11173 SS5]
MPPSQELNILADAYAEYSEQETGSRFWLFPRKGGGGRGGGGGKGGSSKGGGGKGAKGRASGSASGTGKVSPSKLNTGRAVSAAASSTSKGGGKKFKLGKTSAFPGRQAGGGTRKEIYGTWVYGSGYPYGHPGSFVSGRPFPYVFWPVPIEDGYVGADEYAHHSGTVRPGGNLTTVPIRSNISTTLETFRIVGDNTSVTSVLADLMKTCGVVNSTDSLSVFNASVPLQNIPKPEQIVQWYRASTFGLSLDGYNNTAALPSNAPANNASNWTVTAQTPLPAINMTFLACLNTTIAATLPLVAAENVRWIDRFGGIAGFVDMVIWGFSALFTIVVWICSCVCS